MRAANRVPRRAVLGLGLTEIVVPAHPTPGGDVGSGRWIVGVDGHEVTDIDSTDVSGQIQNRQRAASGPAVEHHHQPLRFTMVHIEGGCTRSRSQSVRAEFGPYPGHGTGKHAQELIDVGAGRVRVQGDADIARGQGAHRYEYMGGLQG
jgi:hypothetical protein